MTDPRTILTSLMTELNNRLIAESYARVAHIPKLAHYTSLNAFKSILRSKELWLSRVRDMRDTSEVTEGAEIVAAALKKLGPQVFKSFRYSETDTGQYFASVRPVLETKTFVLSLCEHGSDQRTDRLTMWRAYGDDGYGLCLVLRKEALLEQRAAGRFPVHWSPIEYETSQELEGRLWRRLANIEEVFRQAPQSALLALKPVLGKIITACLLSLVFSHKNENYFDEQEVRFVRSAFLQREAPPAGAGNRDVGPAAMSKSVFVLPLRDYPEFSINASMTALLDHVIVGPSCQQESNYGQVKELLQANGLAHVEVIRSTIPYQALGRISA